MAKRKKKGEKTHLLVKPEDLIDHPNNPREEMTEEQILSLTTTIRKVGFITDIQCEPRPGGQYRIRAGHLRKYAAIEIGLPTVPISVTYGLKGHEWDAYMVADNKFAQNYPFNTTLLTSILENSEVAGYTFGELGFTDHEANSILGRNPVEEIPLEDASRLDKTTFGSVRCPECGHEFVPDKK